MPKDNNGSEEYARRCALVVPVDSSDHGVRPLSGAFASAVLFREGDRITAKVFNYGTAPSHTAHVEACAFDMAGKIGTTTRKFLAMKLLPTIQPNAYVTVVLPITGWTNGPYRQDIVQIQAYDIVGDPLCDPCNPIADRHVGQWGYPLTGSWTGLIEDGSWKIVITESPWRVQVTFGEGVAPIDTGADVAGKQCKFLRPLGRPGKMKDPTYPFRLHPAGPNGKVDVFYQHWTLELIDNNSLRATVQSAVPGAPDMQYQLVRE